jgi:hypothetical protein
MTTPRAPQPPPRRARLPSADRVGVLVRPLYSPAQRARAEVWLPRLLADLAAASSASPGEPPSPDDVDRNPAGTTPAELAPTPKQPSKR